MWSRSRNSITTTFPNEPPSVPCLPFYRPWSSLNPPRPHWLAAESNEPLTGVLRANTLNWHRLLLFSFLFFDFSSRSRCCSWWINYGRIYFSLKEETKWAPVSPHSPSHISFNIILTFACPPTPQRRFNLSTFYLHSTLFSSLVSTALLFLANRWSIEGTDWLPRLELHPPAVAAQHVTLLIARGTVIALISRPPRRAHRRVWLVAGGAMNRWMAWWCAAHEIGSINFNWIIKTENPHHTQSISHPHVVAVKSFRLLRMGHYL